MLNEYDASIGWHSVGHYAEDCPSAVVIPGVDDPEHQVVARSSGDGVEEVAADDSPAIIAEMPVHIATLSVSEAVIRMDLADAPVMMFRHSATRRLNVVYRRKDGNIGWIDPSEDEDK